MDIFDWPSCHNHVKNWALCIASFPYSGEDYGDLFDDEEDNEIPFVVEDSYMNYEFGDDCHVKIVRIHFENTGATLTIDDPEKLKDFEKQYLSDKVTGCTVKEIKE